MYVFHCFSETQQERKREREKGKGQVPAGIQVREREEKITMKEKRGEPRPAQDWRLVFAVCSSSQLGTAERRAERGERTVSQSPSTRIEVSCVPLLVVSTYSLTVHCICKLYLPSTPRCLLSLFLPVSLLVSHSSLPLPFISSVLSAVFLVCVHNDQMVAVIFHQSIRVTSGTSCH